MTRRHNMTFNGEPQHNTNFNACVGNNGLNDMAQYAEGYLLSVEILLEQVHGRPADVDLLVYPIIYNARHGVELVLKDVMIKMADIPRNAGIDLQKITTSHDLGLFWTELKSKSILVDRRFSEYIDKLDRHILDYAEIDPTGQTFRYPHDSNSNDKHLVNTSIIGLSNFQRKFLELKKLLEDLTYLTENIKDEYSLGTYTAKLSRCDLEEIARKLPPRAEWVNDSFGQKKSEIIAEYNLSSNDFSKALTIIEKHPTFAFIIGIEIPLTYTTEEQLENILTAQQKDVARGIEDMLSISVNAIAEVTSLYHLGHYNERCEHFPSMLEEQLIEIECQELSHYLSYYFHRGGSFREHVIRGLRIMGNNSVADQITL